MAALQRIEFILGMYAEWLRQRGRGDSIFALIDERMSSKYDFARFLSDYRAVVAMDRAVLAEAMPFYEALRPFAI